jgi:hypothetical protein
LVKEKIFSSKKKNSFKKRKKLALKKYFPFIFLENTFQKLKKKLFLFILFEIIYYLFFIIMYFI